MVTVVHAFVIPRSVLDCRKRFAKPVGHVRLIWLFVKTLVARRLKELVGMIGPVFAFVVSSNAPISHVPARFVPL